jgi:hypothetical protein
VELSTFRPLFRASARQNDHNPNRKEPITMGKSRETTIEGTTAKGNTWSTTIRGTEADVAEVQGAFAAGGDAGKVVKVVEIDD